MYIHYSSVSMRHTALRLHRQNIGKARRTSLFASIRRQKGFTIIEVALATFVMAFGIATSILAMQMGFRALDVARDSTLAAQIMQSEIERLRLLPWNKPSTTAVDSIRELVAEEAVTLTSMFTTNTRLAGKFTVIRKVDDDTTRADVRYITLIVSWNSYDGRAHTRQFRTMYAKNGLYDYYYTLANPS
jgi:Tfp pilus assembly protein PilV